MPQQGTQLLQSATENQACRSLAPSILVAAIWSRADVLLAASSCDRAVRPTMPSCIASPWPHARQGSGSSGWVPPRITGTGSSSTARAGSLGFLNTSTNCLPSTRTACAAAGKFLGQRTDLRRLAGRARGRAGQAGLRHRQPGLQPPGREGPSLAWCRMPIEHNRTCP